MSSLLPQIPNVGKGVIDMVVMLITALYVISPIDFIPDVFFPVGYIDDLFVILACCSYLGYDFMKMNGIKR